jgi:hypothetical protein
LNIISDLEAMKTFRSLSERFNFDTFSFISLDGKEVESEEIQGEGAAPLEISYSEETRSLRWVRRWIISIVSGQRYRSLPHFANAIWANW